MEIRSSNLAFWNVDQRVVHCWYGELLRDEGQVDMVLLESLFRLSLMCVLWCWEGLE